MRKDSTEFGNQVFYTESFRLITSYGILGGNLIIVSCRPRMKSEKAVYSASVSIPEYINRLNT
jgi:hypothetical protein